MHTSSALGSEFYNWYGSPWVQSRDGKKMIVVLDDFTALALQPWDIKKAHIPEHLLSRFEQSNMRNNQVRQGKRSHWDVQGVQFVNDSSHTAIISFKGRYSAQSISDCEMYDIKNETTTQILPISTPRHSHPEVGKIFYDNEKSRRSRVLFSCILHPSDASYFVCEILQEKHNSIQLYAIAEDLFEDIAEEIFDHENRCKEVITERQQRKNEQERKRRKKDKINEKAIRAARSRKSKGLDF